MPVTVACPSCAAKLRAPDTAVGRKIKCPKCGGVLSVPAVDEAADLAALAVRAEPPQSAPSPPEDCEAEYDDEERAPPPRRRRGAQEDEEREPAARRRRAQDGDEDDEPRRRRSRRRRDADSGQQGGGLPMETTGSSRQTSMGTLAPFDLRVEER